MLIVTISAVKEGPTCPWVGSHEATELIVWTACPRGWAVSHTQLAGPKKATGRSHKSPVSPQSTSEPGHWLPSERPTGKSLRLEDSLPRFLPAAEAKPPGAHQEAPHLPASPALPSQEPRDKGGHPRFITSGTCTNLKTSCF